MNYYLWFHRDHAAATRGLTWVEDLALRRLLEFHYDTERALSSDLRTLCKRIGATSTAQKRAVADMLDQFFVKSAEGWTNRRAMEQLEKARKVSEAKRANGRMGGRPPNGRKQQLSESDGVDHDQAKADAFNGSEPMQKHQLSPGSLQKKADAKPTTNYELRTKNNGVSDTSVVACVPENSQLAESGLPAITAFRVRGGAA